LEVSGASIWKVVGLICKIAGALEKRICNLENVEGFTCKIGGLGLICNYNSKTRGLIAKSIKNMDCGLDYKKSRGFLTNFPGFSGNDELIPNWKICGIGQRAVDWVVHVHCGLGSYPFGVVLSGT
jgi:hypothetical protein